MIISMNKRRPRVDNTRHARSAFWRTASLVALLTSCLPFAGASPVEDPSNWDRGLLSVEFHDVRVEGAALVYSWDNLNVDLLLRSCIYRDAQSDLELKHFVFRRASATGSDIVRAFLETYPDYTYTQDPETGIIWFHRKDVTYDSIFSQKVKLTRNLTEASVWGSVLPRLGEALGTPVAKATASGYSSAFVTLSAGIYSIRDILNRCLIENPHMSFFTMPGEQITLSLLMPMGLLYMNPIAPPRPPAIRFWNVEFGIDSASPPTLGDLRAGMADSAPRHRWAANQYRMLAGQYYKYDDVIASGDDREKAVWRAIGQFPFNEGAMQQLQQFITNELPKSNRALAFVALMALAAKKYQRNADGCGSRRGYCAIGVRSCPARFLQNMRFIEHRSGKVAENAFRHFRVVS